MKRPIVRQRINAEITVMHCITTFWSTTDCIYDGGPIILDYITLYYNT
jgi:hypothetical protein